MFSNTTFGPGILYDGLGKPIGTCIKDGEEDTLPEIYYDPDYTETVDPPTFTLRNPQSLECELEVAEPAINVPLLRELAGLNSKPQPFCMEYDGYKIEQVRRHKKKRINKKWAKRYGYREVPCRYRMENCYINHERFDDFNIISDPLKIICSNLYGRFGGE